MGKGLGNTISHNITLCSLHDATSKEQSKVIQWDSSAPQRSGQICVHYTLIACITSLWMVQIMAILVDSNFIPTFYISTKKVESKYNLCRCSLKSSTTATSLLPGGIRGNGGAIFNTSDLHASSGQRPQGRLRSGSGGLGPVSSGGSQLDVKGSDTQSFDLRFKIMLNLTMQT